MSSPIQTIIPDEFVILDPVYAPGSAPTAFVVEGSLPVIAAGDYAEFRCPASYTVLAAFPGQPGTDTTVASEITDGGNTYRTELNANNRNLQPNGWRSIKTQVSPPATIWDHEWLRRGGGDPFNRVPPFSPTGTSVDIDERWIERFSNTPSENQTRSRMFVHNPTMSGTGFRPDDGYVADTAKIYTGKPLMWVTQQQFPGQRDAVVEGAMIPTDFGGDPKTDPPWFYADHGQGTGIYDSEGNRVEDKPVWWWRMRMWRQFRPNWNEMPRIARIDSASWFPVPINNTVRGGLASPIVAYFSETCHTVPGLFDEVYVLDIPSGTLTQLTNARAPGGEFSQTWEAAYRVMKHRMVQRWTGQATVAVATPSASGYPAIVLRRTADDFTVAYASKIFDCNESTAVDSRFDTQLPCMLQFDHRTFTTTTPLSLLSFEGDILSCTHKSQTARLAGWILSRSWVYTGEWSNLVADLQTLYSAGDLDTLPAEENLPLVVRQSVEPSIIYKNTERLS